MASPIVSLKDLNTTALEGKLKHAYRRYLELHEDSTSWVNHWMELSDYLLPRRGRYLIEAQNSRGRRRQNKIVDGTGTQALRTMAAGMMSGMTSPSRPWFRFRMEGEDLNDRHVVKEWLGDVERVVRSILHASNFYTSAHTIYEEMGAFGTAAMYRERDFNNVIRFRPFTAGEYYIGENDLGVVDTVVRRFTMSVWQIYRKFVLSDVTQPDKEDWTGVSDATRRLWQQGAVDELCTIIHVIEPRPLAERDVDNPTSSNKPYRSMYFEEANTTGSELLQEDGYDALPVYVPRWDVLGGDIYGRGPGMDALPDIKQLQHEQKRKAQAIDKMVNPPMVGATSLRGKPSSVIPGHTTYVDPTQGSQGFQPAYMVQPRIQEMLLDIQEVQERIQRGFFADIFAMMINSDRRQITATEVAERHEEKLVLLGPVLQRVNTELLDPMLEDVVRFAAESGRLPEAPPEIQGMEMRVDYVSLLAQAQQAVSATSIERTLSFAGNLAGVKPSVLDNIDFDAGLREYSEVLGNTPEMLRDPRDVQRMRQRRAQARRQQERQQQAETAKTGAEAAKLLAETDTQNPNALSALTGRRTV